MLDTTTAGTARRHRLSLAALLVNSLLASAAAAQTCPRAVAGYPDGCANAPAQGAFQNSAFGAYARQSGQQWVSSHPQPWDVAGWDYAVGYSRVPAPGFYPLLKPDLATRGGAGSGSNLPYSTATNGCVYTPTGNPYIAGAPAVFCKGNLPANGAGAYAGKVVISGIDFSADSAGNCVQLVISSKTNLTIYVVNNNFRKGPTCYTSSSAKGDDALLAVAAYSNSLVLLKNVFDGAAPYFTDQGNLVNFYATGTVDAEYNAFLNSASRPLNGDGRSGWTARFNYVDGLTIGPGAPHGEIIAAFPTTNGATIAYQDMEFNTAVWGVNTSGVDGVNAGAFGSGAGDGQTMGRLEVANNTLISNLGYGGTIASGKVLLSVEIPYLNSLILRDNYADPTGAYTCLEVEGDEVTLSGYIDDGRGIGGVYDGVPGNVFHVTARGRKDFILVGAQLFQDLNSGLPGNPAITGAVGYVCNGVTMTGSTTSVVLQTAPYATYCISGPAKAVSGLKTVQTMPQIANVQISGNVDLLDGAPITQGPSLRMSNGRCDGKGGAPISPQAVITAAR